MAGNFKGKGRSRSAYQELYINPLPLLPTKPSSFLASFLPHALGGGVKIENPRCVGIFDAPTRSVWIVNARDRDILWRRGFFGKGNLSRSEPSWKNRRVNQLGGAKGLCLLLAVQYENAVLTGFDTLLVSCSFGLCLPVCCCSSDFECITSATHLLPIPFARLILVKHSVLSHHLLNSQ